MLKDVNFRSNCPLTSLIDMIGDKWSLIIIRDLFLDRNTYTEFLKSPEGIATNILVDRLKKLQSFELISYFKKVGDNKMKYYYLTDKGIDLYSMICEMSLWSKKHLKFREMHPLGVDLFNRIEKKGLSCEISDTIEAYENKRENLLSEAN